MALTEMIQASPLVALVQPSTPPSSPSLPSSGHVVTWSNAQELFDMLKAMVAMQVGSTPASKCTACLATSCYTSPTNQTSPQIVTSEHVQQFLDILRSLSTTQGPAPLPAKPSGESGEPKAPASRLAFKNVNEVYVSNAGRF
ncbi:unnamed protein product [Sphagnum balticum]